jgi:transposase-like protein
MPQAKRASGADSRKKTNYTPQFKFERAIDLLKSENVFDVSRKYGLNANLLCLWKGQLLERGPQAFETSPNQAVRELKIKVARLEQMLGKKEVELNLFIIYSVSLLRGS